MVLFQNCVRQSCSPTKMADTVQLRCYWKQLWSRWAITGSWEPLVFIQTRRFLWEFPIGSYVKLSSAVAASLVGGLKCRTQFWIISVKFGWDWLSNFIREEFLRGATQGPFHQSLVANEKSWRTDEKWWQWAKNGIYILLATSSLKPLNQIKPNLAGMVPGWVPFKIVSNSPALYSRWLLLIKIEISSIVHCCFSISQNELKF
jgi:hypothetical protein